MVKPTITMPNGFIWGPKGPPPVAHSSTNSPLRTFADEHEQGRQYHGYILNNIIDAIRSAYVSSGLIANDMAVSILSAPKIPWPQPSNFAGLSDVQIAESLLKTEPQYQSSYFQYIIALGQGALQAASQSK